MNMLRDSVAIQEDILEHIHLDLVSEPQSLMIKNQRYYGLVSGVGPQVAIMTNSKIDHTSNFINIYDCDNNTFAGMKGNELCGGGECVAKHG